MPEKPKIYQATQFDKIGIAQNPFTDNGATKVEHFDTIDGSLRPFHDLALAVTNGLGGASTATLALTKFAQLSGTIYALGKDNSNATYPAIYQWNTASDFRTKWTFNAARTAWNVLIAHANYLYGMASNSGTTYIWKMDTTGTYTDQHSASLGTVSTVADPITHSKDGKAYFPYDNKIWSLTSAGADGGLLLTLPNSNFRITSISEQGNYINIVGYDTKTNQSASLLWDRDSSVTDLTETYQLGPEQVWHNAYIGGNMFFVQIRTDATNTVGISERPVLVIKYLNGNVAETLLELPLSSITSITTGGGKWVSNDRLYFTALVKFIGENAAVNRCFVLDSKGRLRIAQNISVDSGSVAISGVYREGDGFWFAGGSDGTWASTSTYANGSTFETTDIRADDLSKNLQLSEVYVMTEALPASGQVVINAKINDDILDGSVAYTTLKTFTGTDKMRHKLTAQEAVNALPGLDRAKVVRLQAVSTVGATITGLQATFLPVTDQGNG